MLCEIAALSQELTLQPSVIISYFTHKLLSKEIFPSEIINTGSMFDNLAKTIFLYYSIILYYSEICNNLLTIFQFEDILIIRGKKPSEQIKKGGGIYEKNENYAQFH